MMSVQRWIQGVCRFFQLDFAEQTALLRVMVLAAAAELGVRTAPLPRLCRWFGTTLSAVSDTQPGTGSFTPDVEQRRDIAAVRRVMRNWPFADGVCLRESLVLARLLRRHHPRLVLGVRRIESRVLAHAWIEVDGCVIGDGRGFEPLSPPMLG